MVIEPYGYFSRLFLCRIISYDSWENIWLGFHMARHLDRDSVRCYRYGFPFLVAPLIGSIDCDVRSGAIFTMAGFFVIEAW